MICSTFLEEISLRLTDLVNRGRMASAVLTSEQLNWSPGHGLWTIGQIFEHLHLADEPYLVAMDAAIDRAPFGGNKEARHTWIGSMIIKASGPSGNAPVPKKFQPGGGPFDASVIQTYIDEHQRAIELAKRASDANLSGTIVRNPLMPVFRMNLTDCFEIVTAHAERHMGQIEEIMRHPDFPKA